jgi:hypothetical protein
MLKFMPYCAGLVRLAAAALPPESRGRLRVMRIGDSPEPFTLRQIGVSIPGPGTVVPEPGTGSSAKVYELKGRAQNARRHRVYHPAVVKESAPTRLRIP